MSNYSDLIHEGENRVYEHVEHKCIERTVGENNSVSWKEHVLFPKNTLSDVFLTSHSKSTIENKISYYGNATKISSNILQVGVKDDIYDDFLKNGSHITITFNGDYSNYAASTPFIPVIRLADTATGTTHLINGTTDVYLYKSDDEFISKDDISVGDTIEFIYRYKDADHKGLYMVNGQKAYYNKNENEAALYVQTIDKYGCISSYRKVTSDDIPFENVDYNYLHSIIGLASSTKDGLMASTDYIKLHSFSDFNRAAWDKNGEKVYKVQMSSDDTDKNLYVQVPWNQDTDTQYYINQSINNKILPDESVPDVVTSNTNTIDKDQCVSVWSFLKKMSDDTIASSSGFKLFGSGNISISMSKINQSYPSITISSKNKSNRFEVAEITSSGYYQVASKNLTNNNVYLTTLNYDEDTKQYDINSDSDSAIKIVGGANSSYNLYAVDVSFDKNNKQLVINTQSVTNAKLGVDKGGTGTNTFNEGEVLIGHGTGAVTTTPISTTVEDKANLITSSAVYNKLSDYVLSTSLSKYVLKTTFDKLFNSTSLITTIIPNFGATEGYQRKIKEADAIKGAIGTDYDFCIIIASVSDGNRYFSPRFFMRSMLESEGGINFYLPETSMYDAYVSIVDESSNHDLKGGVIEINSNGNYSVYSKRSTTDKSKIIEIGISIIHFYLFKIN